MRGFSGYCVYQHVSIWRGGAQDKYVHKRRNNRIEEQLIQFFIITKYTVGFNLTVGTWMHEFVKLLINLWNLSLGHWINYQLPLENHVPPNEVFLTCSLKILFWFWHALSLVAWKRSWLLPTIFYSSSDITEWKGNQQMIQVNFN